MKLIAASFVLVCLAAPRAIQAQTVIDFEDLSAGAIVNTQYAAKGVVFPFSAFLYQDPHAHSGTHALRLASLATEFPPGPLVIEFTAGQRSVKFFARVTTGTVPVQGTATAFNAAGAVVATDGPKPVQPDSYNTSFVLTSAQAAIVKVELNMAQMEFEAIDDLTFTGKKGTLPNTAPVVKITSPANGAELNSQNALLTGTITGASLLPNPVATMDIPGPPGAPPPPFTFSLPMTGSGNVHNFSWSGGTGLGPQTLTVKATNIAGLTGTASVKFDYLPQAIKDRFQNEGGAAKFGSFVYGIGGGLGCTIAIYQQGAIFYLNSNTFLALGTMFAKWQEANGKARSDLRCATSEETPLNGFAGATRQDFQRGRLYSSGGQGFYVPPVFADAIDKLGGEVATGIPISDPANLPPTPVWNFQRFQRADNTTLASTLEIWGSPPVLYVQRQGGDLTDLQRAGLSLTPTTATLELSFQCSGPDGPCSITPPMPTEPFPGTDAARICFFGVYPDFWVREWEPVADDQTLTSLSGFVKNANPSPADNPLSHTNHGDIPFPSDFLVDTLPLTPFRNILSQPNTRMEVEYEEAYARALEAGWGWPIAGDLLFVAGRWVVDCGHNDHANYHSEIHPAAVLIFSKTTQHLGRPATDTILWANGYYSGAPLDFVVEAPPKPSPDANLVLEKPTDLSAALGLTLQLSWDAHAVKGHFEAPRRQMAIDSATGQMFWQDSRGYQGEWLLYWDK